MNVSAEQARVLSERGKDGRILTVLGEAEDRIISQCDKGYQMMSIGYGEPEWVLTPLANRLIEFGFSVTRKCTVRNREYLQVKW